MRALVFAAATAALWAVPPAVRADSQFRLEATSAETGIRIESVADSGILYVVSGAALDITSSGAASPKRSGDDIVFPALNSSRDGCMVTTPWLPVAYEAGRVVAYPHFHARWRVVTHEGVTRAAPDVDVPLVDFTITVRRGQSTAAHVTSSLHSRDLTYGVRQAPVGLGREYIGTFDNIAGSPTEETFGRAQVKDGDSFQLAVCNVQPGVELVIRDVALESVPTGP